MKVFEAGESVPMQERQRPFARRAQRHVLNFHAENDVVEDRAPRQQEVLLQHVADAADRAGSVDPINEHAPASRLQQSGDDVENGGFAAARGPDQADEAALRDGKRDRRERAESAAARPEGHAHVGNAKFWGRGRHADFARSYRGSLYSNDIAKTVPTTNPLPASPRGKGRG